MDPLTKAGDINKDLDVGEFFPYSSAFSDGQGRIASILDSLVKEGMYGCDGHWKLPEGHMSSEEKWAQIFDRVLYHASLQDCPEWNYMQMAAAWVAHEKTMIDGLRKPDVILVPRRYQFQKDVPFSAVLTYTEVKETNNKRNVDLAVQQLRDCAGFAIACQANRDYFVGSVLAGRALTIVLCARDVTYCSTSIDIDGSPRTFIKAIIALSAGYAKDLGFDPLFKVDHRDSWTVELDGRRLTVTRRLFLRSVTMTGRGTRVLLCRDEENRPYVLKDSWVSDGESDETFVHEMFQTYQPHHPLDPGIVADTFGAADRFNVFRNCWSGLEDSGWDAGNRLPGIPLVTYAGYTRQTTQSIHDGFTGNNLSFTRRKHLHVILETCGVPITWFSSRREFLNAMMCVVIAHFTGKRHGFLHCDIGEGNVWLSVEDPEDEEKVILPWCERRPNEFPKHAAILGDWGKAKYDGPSSPPGFGDSEPTSVTGSYPFISAEMSSQAGIQGLIPYSAIHDLESLFWVMWIVSVNTTGPYNLRRQWSDKPDPNTGFLGSMRKPVDANEDDLDPPAWATPGIHPVSLSEIHSFKSSIPKRQFLSAMSSYWKDGESGLIFQDGMRRLREHFEWTEVSNGKFQPPRSITHQKFINILRDMRDNIPPEEDRQTMASVQQARARYREMLADVSRDMSTGLLDQSAHFSRSSARNSPQALATTARSPSGSKRKAKEVTSGAPDGSKRTRQAWEGDPSGDAQDEDGRGAGLSETQPSASTSHPDAGKTTPSPQKSKHYNSLRKFRT